MESITWEDRDGKRWIALEGEFDHEICLALKSRLEEAVAGGTGDVVLVMSGVTFLVSMGIGIILDQHKNLEREGRTLLLQGMQPSVRSIFASMKLLSVLKEIES